MGAVKSNLGDSAAAGARSRRSRSDPTLLDLFAGCALVSLVNEHAGLSTPKLRTLVAKRAYEIGRAVLVARSGALRSVSCDNPPLAIESGTPRDLFVAASLIGWLSESVAPTTPHGRFSLARQSLEIANAMIAVRDRDAGGGARRPPSPTQQKEDHGQRDRTRRA